MKTTKTITLVLALCVMNQFANAQKCNHNKPCPNGKICYCQDQIHLNHCNCVYGFRYAEASNLNEWTLDIATIYPNPISNSTTISFSLSHSQNVSLKIFDVNGRLVSTLTDATFEEGDNEIIWNASDAGVYFLQMQTAENLETEKLIVTK
ncbi:MAG TPA: T9SS type A sorting domain-containing protein [Chitinophagales bacterium]|nr:T9SS type A sorting domain-containing protein [Chitinophagales bacterium]